LCLGGLPEETSKLTVVPAATQAGPAGVVEITSPFGTVFDKCLVTLQATEPTVAATGAREPESVSVAVAASLAPAVRAER
jgi:hypothetical protein